MKIRKNDNVIVIMGKDKGKKGKVLAVFNKKNLVLVEGVGMTIKHVKQKDKNDKVGKVGRVEVTRPISASNVMFFDSEKNKVSRLSMKKDGKKYIRVSKSSNKAV